MRPEHRWTRRTLGAHVAALGLGPGDSVMLHAGLRSVGPMLNGPDALIGAILDVVTATGTLLVYTSWDECYEDYIDAEGRPPESLRADIPPFDPAASRANRDHGAIAELVRTWPGALRSGNPGASVAAVGARAEWFTKNHPLDYGYGAGSPFDKLVQARGKVLMVGAPLDTMTLLHHAEHRAAMPGKRVHRVEVPLLIGGRVSWRLIEEFDTKDPVVEGLKPDYFGEIVQQFMKESGVARAGKVGAADAVLVPAAEIVEFAVRWLERWVRAE